MPYPILKEDEVPKHLTITEMATRLIRERILSGQYRSGTRLIPTKLEAELGLGRVAIREALRNWPVRQWSSLLPIRA